MEFLTIRVDVAIARVDIAPLLVGIGPGHWWLALGLLSFDIRIRGVGEEGGECHQLCVAGAITGDVGGIHALGNDSSIMDKYTSNRCLIGPQRQAGLGTR